MKAISTTVTNTTAEINVAIIPEFEVNHLLEYSSFGVYCNDALTIFTDIFFLNSAMKLFVHQLCKIAMKTTIKPIDEPGIGKWFWPIEVKDFMT